MAMSQKKHIEYNKTHYPGPRQLWCICGCPTDRCEEDSLYIDQLDPLCEDCYDIELIKAGGIMEEKTNDILKEKIKNWIALWEDKSQINQYKKQKLFAQMTALDFLDESYREIIQDLKTKLREMDKNENEEK